MAISNSIFSLHWYLTHNPDVADAVAKGLVDAFAHFQANGKAEGRSPSPLFNSTEYLNQNPDVALAVQSGTTTAYDHFVQFGASEGRSPLKIFDISYYLARNPDVADAVRAGTTSAVEHFLVHGQGEARAFNPSINLTDYLAANADVAAAVQAGFISGMEHLMVYGVAEGRNMGNGVNLAMFDNDATFQDALTSGDIQGALVRVGDVAPFLPTFEGPAGWTPPADTPIPVDFVPPEGTTLVIPPTVDVPPGTKLPDSFTPPDSYTTSFGNLTAHNGAGFLYAGTTNPASGFVISTNETASLELGLDVRYAGDSINIGHEAGLPQSFVIDATRGADLRFAYSVASTDGAPLDLDTHTYTLRIDTNGGPEQDWVEFTLAADNAVDPNGAPYQWIRTAGTSIADDGGNETVTQNIQAFHWWGSEGPSQPPQYGDKYDLQLQAHNNETGMLVANSSLTVDVGVVPDVDSYGDLVVGQQDGLLYAGTNNPSNGFAISNTHELELGLDVRSRGITDEVAPIQVRDGAQVFNVSSGTGARFAYSAASKGDEIDLSKYDLKLKIDTDGTAATNFLTFKLAKQTEGASASTYEWVGEGAAEGRVIADDGGTTAVTQNIQAVGWYLGEDTSNTALEEGDSYNVQLSAYLAGTDIAVAQTEIIMLVGAQEAAPPQTAFA